MYRRSRLPLPLVFGAIGVGVMSGSFIFTPSLQDYWEKQQSSTRSSPSPLQPEQPKLNEQTKS